MKILAFETTCDETSAAVLEGRTLRSNAVYSQIELHRKYSGVVPELASRAHLEKIPFVLGGALRRAGAAVPLKRGAFDAVAFSRGPGLPGALMVGRVAAEAAAELSGAPLVGVNHLEGHLLACEFVKGRVARPLEFPLLVLIVSGGHTELWHARGYGDYTVPGRTRDDGTSEVAPRGRAVVDAVDGADRRGLVTRKTQGDGRQGRREVGRRGRAAVLVVHDGEPVPLVCQPQHRLDEVAAVRAHHPGGADDRVPRVGTAHRHLARQPNHR